jgi:hypothetical protein
MQTKHGHLGCSTPRENPNDSLEHADADDMHSDDEDNENGEICVVDTDDKPTSSDTLSTHGIPTGT